MEIRGFHLNSACYAVTCASRNKEALIGSEMKFESLCLARDANAFVCLNSLRLRPPPLRRTPNLASRAVLRRVLRVVCAARTKHPRVPSLTHHFYPITKEALLASAGKSVLSSTPSSGGKKHAPKHRVQSKGGKNSGENGKQLRKGQLIKT